jgi:hypothetical protein
MALNYISSVDFIDQDIKCMLEIEVTPDYRKKLSFFELNDEPRTTLKSLGTLPEGKVVEIGVFRKKIFNVLKELYGEENCFGVDFYPYEDDPNIVIGDWRTIHTDYNMDVALFFNGMGSWLNNKTTKQAGLDYAVNNLVTGGFYIDSQFMMELNEPIIHESLALHPASGPMFRIYQKQ